MPAPVRITPLEREWIQNYLQETFAVKVKDTHDCKNLCSTIETSTKLVMSYSTLRRLFNLVANTDAFSRFNLNIMAKAVGFEDWDSFINHINTFDTNTINQNIQVYYRKLLNSSELILTTIKRLPITTWQGGYQLQSIIGIAIENNDFELLEKVVFLSFDTENPMVYEHLVIGFQAFYFQAINKNQLVIDFVTKNIGKSVLLQKCLLQAYVDECQLDTLLRPWFEAVTDKLIPDVQLFKQLLLCQNAYNHQNSSLAKEHFQKASFEFNNANYVVHPILKARMGVWEWILNDNPQKVTTLYTTLKDPFDIADFAVIGSRLIWEYTNAETPILFLDKVKIETVPVIKNFFQKGRHNMLLLTLAINSYLKNDLPKAKSYFEKVDTAAFAYDIVNCDFYIDWIERLEKV